MSLFEIFAFLRACQADPKNNHVQIHFTGNSIVVSSKAKPNSSKGAVYIDARTR